MAILITYEINKGVDVVYTVATSQAEADAAVAELAKNGMTSKLERLAQASLFFDRRAMGRGAPKNHYTTHQALLSIGNLHKLSSAWIP